MFSYMYVHINTHTHTQTHTHTHTHAHTHTHIYIYIYIYSKYSKGIPMMILFIVDLSSTFFFLHFYIKLSSGQLVYDVNTLTSLVKV